MSPKVVASAGAPLADRPLAGTLALLSLAASSLARRTAKTLALGGALALTVTLAAAVLFLTDALRGAAGRVRDGAPDLVVQRLAGGRPTLLDASFAARLRDLDSVRSVRARVWGYLFVPAVSANVVVVGVASDAPMEAQIAGAISEGRALSGRGETLLGAALARALGLRVGDEVRLPVGEDKLGPPLRVVGVFAPAVEVYTSDLVLVGDDDARALLGVGAGEATDLAVSLVNPAEARVVSHAAIERVPGARVVDRALMARVHELAFGRRGGLALAALLPALLAFLVLGWDRMSSLGAEERREISVLKAVGFATRDVVFVRMCESLVLSLAATALGVAVAYAWVFVFGAPGLRSAIAGFGVLQGDAPLVPTIDAAQLFGLVLGVVGPFVALSVLPAWRAAVVDPMEGMRG